MRDLAGTAKGASGLAAARTFELAVSAAGPRRYRLEARAKTQGSAVAEVAVERLPSPLSSLLEQPTSGEELRQIGHELSCLLFTGDVGRLFDRALGEVLAGDVLFLRLVLRIDPPELAVLPWELLFSAERELFLGSSPRTTITRTLSLMLLSARSPLPRPCSASSSHPGALGCRRAPKKRPLSG